MSRILKNTTLSDIELNASGFTIPASGQLSFDQQDFILLASDDSIAELTPLINSGDIIVNDGQKDLFPRQGINWLKYPDNFIETETVYVSTLGSNTEGDGSLARPLKDLTGVKNLLDNGYITASATSPLGIKCESGVYDQAPVDFSGYQYILIQGRGPRTRFKATDPNSTLLKIGPNSSLRSVSFEGVTAANAYHIDVNMPNGGVASIDDLFITNGTNGITSTCTSGLASTSISSMLSTNLTGEIITADANTRLTLNQYALIGTPTSTAFTQKSSGELICLTGRISDFDTAIKIEGNTGDVQVIGLTSLNTTKALDQIGTSTLELLGGNFDVTNSNITDISVITGYFFNELQNEKQLRILNELSVGLPGQGKESSLGEGDSYYTGSLIFTWDDGTFTNVTSQSTDPTNGTFQFPSTAPNRGIYVSTALKDTNGNFQKFPGLKVELIQGAILGNGEIIIEYWDGASWVEFNHMSEGELTADYQKYGKDCLTRAANEQILFDNSIISDWQAHDPIGLGFNSYWIRFRTFTGIDQVPIFDAIKIHTNRTEINQDGFMQHYGAARVYKTLSTDITFLGTVRVPADQNVFLSKFLSVGKAQNEFFAGNMLSSSDLAGAVFRLPTDADTSSKALLDITYTSSDTGTLELYVDWAHTSDLDTIYQSDNAAPTNYPNQKSTIVSQIYNIVNRQKTITVELDISDFEARDAEGRSDLFWVGLNISDGTTLDPMTVINLSLRYLSNESGGHL